MTGLMVTDLEQVDDALFQLSNTELTKHEATIAAKNLLMQSRLIVVRALKLQEKSRALKSLPDDKLATETARVNNLREEFSILTDMISDATREYYVTFGDVPEIAHCLRIGGLNLQQETLVMHV